MSSIPGVEGVAFASTRPKYSFSFTSYFPDIDTVGKKLPAGIFTAVSPEYFSVTGTKLLRGRTFSRNDQNAPFTVIVNQAMADGLWPNQDPIGHCIRFEQPTQPCATVIGVAQTAILSTIGEPASPHFYVSLDNLPLESHGASEIIVRADPSRVVAVQASLREMLRAEFPGGIAKLTTMVQSMEPEYRPWKLGATLFTLFGVLALVVSGIGIYSTVSYATNQRTKEFGVRIALGARGVDVVRQVLGDGLRTVVVGVVMGILMALAASRFIASLLYGIAPSDPGAMAIVTAVLLAVAALAALLPAWRAAKADPVSALRAE
jgi:hypothetical protein